MKYLDGNKFCTKCRETKSLNEFTFNKKLRPVTPCKLCRAKAIKKKRTENPEWRKREDKKSQVKYNKFYTENGVDLTGDKFCNDCKRWYPKSEFALNRSSCSGLSSYCKLCANVRASRYRGTPYKITRAEYDRIFEFQKGVCGICFQKEWIKKRRLDTDHNHLTSEVRGLLCSRCNRCIGAMKDNIEWLNNAVIWVKNNGVRSNIYTKGGELIDKII